MELFGISIITIGMFYVFGMAAVSSSLRAGMRVWRSIGPLTYPILMALFGAIAVITFWSKDTLQRTVMQDQTAATIGLALLLLFVVLRVSSILTIGWRSLFSVPLVAPTGKETIVAKGPYRFLRHPIWLSYLSLSAGAFLASGAMGFIIAFALWLIATPFLVEIEERELRGRLGEPFESYTRKVPWKVAPGVY